MAEISSLGWFHTSVAIIALIAGFYTIAVHSLTKPKNATGKIYLTGAFIAEFTASKIYQQGGFDRRTPWRS